ncbi:M20 family metallopeptidase [Microtetraspora fusca]|uniref:M20 family metallopeptidase n=1 Tax=Microtetraspora fusca TaxID=1997 RepID=UPI00082AFDF9|nr:ArgE/DapE family deacylase [Microtetraspora fusca]
MNDTHGPATLSSRLADSVRQAVEDLADEHLELLAESLRRDTSGGHEDRVASLYEEYLRDRGWDVRRQSMIDDEVRDADARPGERFNVIASRPGASGPRVALNGHMDVVPVANADAWTHPPFAGRRMDGKVHGRGACDMKGGIAAGLLAVAALDRAGIRPPLDLVWHLVVGEETTGIGTRVALREGPVPDAVVVLEPTESRIVPISSGLLFFSVTVHGRTAHTSAPWAGEDAFERLMRVRQAWIELAEKRTAAYRHPLFAHLPSAIPFAIGTVSAGAWRAAVPDLATMAGRIGLAPGESAQRVRDEFEAAVARVSAGDPWLAEHPVEVEWGHELLGWETPREHPLVASLAAGQEEIGAAAREPLAFTAGSDAAYYGGRGVPTVIYGPGRTALAHADDEHVIEADVVECAAVLAVALADYARRATAA